MLPTVQSRVESSGEERSMERGPVEVLFVAFPNGVGPTAEHRLLA
jgi:hypothetical protein